MSYCRMHYNLPNPLTPSFSHHFLIPALILPQSPKKKRCCRQRKSKACRRPHNMQLEDGATKGPRENTAR